MIIKLKIPNNGTPLYRSIEWDTFFATLCILKILLVYIMVLSHQWVFYVVLQNHKTNLTI
jgi:hypothetical protein